MAVSSQTKDSIFQYTTPGNIYLKFLNLTELPKGNISSPFSEDKKASFRVYKNGTFKCFSTGKQGDAIQFVADLFKLDCKTQFPTILKTIATEMQVDLKQKTVVLQNGKTHQQNEAKTKQKMPKTATTEPTSILQNTQKPFKISVVNREMSESDFAFWNGLGVDEQLLKRYGVGAVENFTFYSESKNKDILWKVNNYLAFSYQVNENYEVYIPNQPNRKRAKFFCNGLTKDDIFGLAQLQNKKNDFLIICAGKKDALVSCSRGFPAVSFRSENHFPTQEQISILQNCCKTLFICYDNDNGGRAGKEKILAAYPNIISITLPEEINDLADYFQTQTAVDFQILIDATKTENPHFAKEEKDFAKDEITTIFHIAEKYLSENYEFRYNVISLAIECKQKSNSEWTVCNENSLWIELQKKSIKIPLNSLIAILKSGFVPIYNPIITYFENLPIWDGQTDYITSFAKYVNLEESENQEQFEYHFKKWCVRAVKCATIENYFNKQAFILTDDGLGQNIGKTSWCRFVCPPFLSEYIAQDIPENEKDARILFAKNFLVNLDELASLSRKEINKLKSYFTLDKINERLPYDRKNSIIPRVASFIGSTNMSTFLQDETGSVRWLCFIVKSINWNYKTEFDINNLWSQAYALSLDKNFDSEMSREDIRNNELRNEKFQIVSPEMDLIREHFEKATKVQNAEFLTSTGILQHLNLQGHGIRLTSVGIGKALTANGFVRAKNNGFYGYWVKRKVVINSNVDI